MVDFIGVGAQKSGTSWAYTCLYEHPEICAPIKEIHFFSRPRFEKGREWYEAHFKKCDEGKVRGEFSTSYLYAPEAPLRIHAYYPDVKLIAILRNPVDRAFSQYRNAIKAGEISETVTFETYANENASVREQGRYFTQLSRYLALFPREQLLILIHEDSRKNPVDFMQRIYTFLGVDASFVSSMVHTPINVARTPKFVFVDRLMHHVSESMRKGGLDRLVHLIRKSGLPDLVRSGNTKSDAPLDSSEPYDRARESAYYRDEVGRLSRLIERNMNEEWNI